MNLLKILFTLIALLFFSLKTKALEFEGSLTLTKITLYDTVYFNFSVLENLIRMDQQNSKKEIIQSLIIDLNSEKITALSPNHKLYTHIQKKQNRTGQHAAVKVIQTENFKYINGYKCFQWRVRNESSEISYWVFNSGYNFFQKAIYLLNNTEDYSSIFGPFSEIQNAGSIPILSVERTLLREEKSKIMVTNISTCKINAQLFTIPKEYNYLRY